MFGYWCLESGGWRLMAGGTERYDVALKRFDLDASQAAFWSLGLDMISDMIDELEGLT